MRIIIIEVILRYPPPESEASHYLSIEEQYILDELEYRELWKDKGYQEAQKEIKKAQKEKRKTQGREKQAIINIYKKGFTKEDIADLFNKSIKDIVKILGE